ncbi:DUF4062 domain-containing protein [uncultured Microbacterium sp.]|uniref:DUF4062 domain-containing protein n=1 Tax=uncultured Microbacterium sp. TaxID=191216 RepID=UPI00261AB39A|nr:DUF4062 domain-containing protein [uncultured Microbacterium sp.]
MSYHATVLRVMIASPSDVPEARDAVERALYSWNASNSRNKKVVLVPWRWETSSVPVLGGHPQALINGQGVDDSDVVFAMFGGRLGSPTPEAISGTVEEIDRALELGKPVHLYFSNGPLPRDVDPAQLAALNDFKRSMQERGILGEFSNSEQLNHEVWKAIEHDLQSLKLEDAPAAPTKPSGVEFMVQPDQEQQPNGFSKAGRPRYRTRRWLTITNSGNVDAHGVTYEQVGDSGLLLMTAGEPTVVHAGQTRRVNYELYAGAENPIMRINWVEAEESRHKDFHIG